MNIVLTGASKGIGFETAIALCNYDIDNLIIISRNKENLLSLKKICNNLNDKINIEIIADDLEFLVKNKESLLSKLKLEKLDIFINNAGYLINKPFLQTELSEIEKTFALNFFIPTALVRMLFELLNNTTPSHVVNVGSMGGFQGSSKFSGLSYYSASKAALACVTECLAVEFLTTNIKVNCLALGAVNTEMLKQAFPEYKAPVNAKEMGEFIADFALNGHKFFNGKILPVSLSTP